MKKTLLEMLHNHKASPTRFCLNERQKADLEVAERAFADYGSTVADAANLADWAIVCGSYIELGKLCQEIIAGEVQNGN